MHTRTSGENEGGGWGGESANRGALKLARKPPEARREG